MAFSGQRSAFGFAGDAQLIAQSNACSEQSVK
jgi:hypothetical protein